MSNYLIEKIAKEKWSIPTSSEIKQNDCASSLGSFIGEEAVKPPGVMKVWSETCKPPRADFTWVSVGGRTYLRCLSERELREGGIFLTDFGYVYFSHWLEIEPEPILPK